MANLPLQGIRVADFTWVWAGPVCTMQLAHLGAEVIKVESSLRTDTLRHIPPYADGVPGPNRSGYFNQYSQGKKSILLDLRHPKGVAVAKRLVAVSDVVAENFSTGVMDKLGLGYQELRRVKPDTIMISFSGYGASGPKKDYVAYGPAQVPMSGLSSLTGYPGGGPREVGISYGDPNAGLHAAFAALAALHYRARTGQGQYIDMSQWEALLGLVSEGIMDYVMNGTQPPRMGNRDPSLAPHGCFRCRGEDDWVTIAVGSEEEWQSLCRAMGQPELAQDPRFRTMPLRKAHEEELEAVITQWTRDRDRWEVTDLLQRHGVAAFPTMTSRDLAQDPHLDARGYFADLEQAEVGPRRHPGIPWQMSGTPCRVRSPAPLLGQHTGEILTGLLGYSPAEVAALQEEGALR
ncbi:MAG: CaiB/BaiF CoA transferase family protein [Dehalococcoidia bacterium]